MGSSCACLLKTGEQLNNCNHLEGLKLADNTHYPDWFDSHTEEPKEDPENGRAIHML